MNLILRSFGMFSIGVLMSLGSTALAELDPDLAATSASAKNDPGLFATGYLMFGVSKAVKTRIGPAVLAGGELGYALPRDSWGRVQGSLFVGSGFLQFKAKDASRAEQQVAIGLMPIVRAGYAYSIGHSASFLWQAGAGAFAGRYSSKIDNVTYKDDSSFIGLVGQFGGQLLMTPSSWYEVVAGIDLTHYAFDIDQLKAQGQVLTAKSSFNVNSPTMSLGFKIRL